MNPPTSKPSVLVVDDESGILDSLNILLRNEGFAPHLAHGGKRGLECIDELSPDIVLTDIRMPNVTGVEILAAARKSDPDMPVPPDWKTKLMHARITIDGEVLMASDATPGDYHQPQGFSVALAVEDPADAERRFNALAEGGTVRMPFGKTFFSNGFGMCVDKFGIPWMVNCPKEDM